MKDNYFIGIGAMVFNKDKILLVRHTYGKSKGKLLNPGGYLKIGEMPFDAIKREVYEETSVIVNPKSMLTVRCDKNGWYMVIIADYVSGNPKSDNNENSEAVFMDYKEALVRTDTTDTVKTLINFALFRKPINLLHAYKERIFFVNDEVEK